jgi:hypothetical protein
LGITSDHTPNGGAWANKADVVASRVADFACGTGTLLSTAYQRMGQLHEIAGGDAESLHPEMMASTLVGCDVLPAAAHLTASMLAGAHPTVNYTRSSVLTVTYGKQPDGGIALGSLDLLDPQRKFEIIDITAKLIEGMGETEKETWLSLPHASFDTVLMNPPFTRSTGHEGKKIGIPRPMFAAFRSTEEEQRLMSRATAKLTARTSAHGNAGEASIFLVLADRKLKPNGTLALVMPVSLMSGDAWEDSRALLAKNYTDLILISIAGAASADMSFSADTDMGECLVIGRKTSDTGYQPAKDHRAVFVVLTNRPAFPMLGAYAARQIREIIARKNLKRLEDGPVGGKPISFGNDVIGHAIDAPIPENGSWHLARIADLTLAQTAYQLVNKGQIWLPSMSKSEAKAVAITTVGTIGKIGPYHADVVGKTASKGIRGPFSRQKIQPNAVPTYPALWAHSAARERAMSFGADSDCLPLKGKTAKEQELVDRKVMEVWATASHCHSNRDFRFNSQATAMQFTPDKTIGGRAWLSIRLASPEQEKALVAWGNTSLGLLLYWWHANKSQDGRGSVGKETLQSLPVLDVTSLTPAQLAAAVAVFDAMCGKELKPFNEIDRDAVRRDLDERFARDVLGLLYTAGGPLDRLRTKLAQEPSIRGGKAGDDDDDDDADGD